MDFDPNTILHLKELMNLTLSKFFNDLIDNTCKWCPNKLLQNETFHDQIVN